MAGRVGLSWDNKKPITVIFEAPGESIEVITPHPTNVEVRQSGVFINNGSDNRFIPQNRVFELNQEDEA